jgi:hypothetical protein
MIRFTCEKCGAAIRVPEEHAGKQGRCPACQAVVTIPAPPPAEVPQSPPPVPRPPYAPAGVPPQPLPPRMPGPPPGKALAICAVVFGALGIFPILGLVGVILGIIVLAGKKPGKGLAVTGLVLGLVLGTGSTVLGFVLLSRARELARQAYCLGNLNSIGKGLHVYAADRTERYPEDLNALIESGYISRQCLKCPSTRGTRECDYVYLKARWDRSGRTIVACDRKGNHRNRRNVLRLDGSCRGMTEAEFQAELAEEHNKEFAEHLRKIEGQ